MCSVSEFIRGKDSLKQHFAERHDENIQMKFYFEFDWVILKLEVGSLNEHGEIIYRTKLGSSFSHLCVTMGFRSDTAKASAKKCNNHHMAWVLILIFHMGTLSELVVDCLFVWFLTTHQPLWVISVRRY